MTINNLTKICKLVRADILKTSYLAHIGHVGSSLSIVEILAALYFQVLKIKPSSPGWQDRDRFILSKGHGALALYSILARRGFFPINLLETFCQEESKLLVHPEFNGLPGIDWASGSLGHGLSIGAGIAYGAKLMNKSFKVFVLISDAELNEGTIWEAALFAGFKKLDNLVVILDYNHSQGLGQTQNILDLEPVYAKWKAFNFDVTLVDGHNLAQLIKSFVSVNVSKNSKPKLFIAKTTLGKGISFMENDFRWHYYDPTYKDLEIGLKDLSLGIKVKN